MTVFDWASIFGALAWVPYLVNLIRNWLDKSKIRVITQRNVEIGFTTYGPIFNIRLAFSVENKDIVISDLKIKLIHEDGEERVFEWQGITQNLGKMILPDTAPMPIEKDQSVLAIKLNQTDIEERYIRFQDPKFIIAKREYEEKIASAMAYLKSEGKYAPESFLRAPEMTNIYNFNKQAFGWKKGKYRLFIEMQSPESFDLLENVRKFTLTPLDIEKMENNRSLLEEDYKRVIIESTEVIYWEWRYPTLEKP